MSNEIKTWQERTGNHNARPGSMKHMLAEIDDLRAALASERTLLNAATSEMEAMEKERDEARAALAQPPAPATPVDPRSTGNDVTLPKWIDDAKGKDQFTDDLIAYIENKSVVTLTAERIVKIGYQVGIIGPVSDGDAVKFARAILAAK